jgi:hypothetical protein
MNQLREWVASQWNCYKYRFVPWIAFNLNEKTVRTDRTGSEPLTSDQLLVRLEQLLGQLVQYSSLRDSLEEFQQLHTLNQARLLTTWGFSVVRLGLGYAYTSTVLIYVLPAPAPQF